MSHLNPIARLTHCDPLSHFSLRNFGVDNPHGAVKNFNKIAKRKKKLTASINPPFIPFIYALHEKDFIIIQHQNAHIKVDRKTGYPIEPKSNFFTIVFRFDPNTIPNKQTVNATEVGWWDTSHTYRKPGYL